MLEWMAREYGSFLIWGLCLGSENPKEMQFFSFQRSDIKYSDSVQENHFLHHQVVVLVLMLWGLGQGIHQSLDPLGWLGGRHLTPKFPASFWGTHLPFGILS